MSELAAAFLGTRSADPAETVLLHDALVRALDAAHVAHPGVTVDALEFAAELGRRSETTTAFAAAVDAQFASDLFLAYACRRGNAPAQRRLRARMATLAASVLSRYDRSPAFADDVVQTLIERLLVADGEREAKLGTYTGRGSLDGFLRVALVRTGQDSVRGVRPGALPDEVRASGSGPEVDYLKRRHGDEFRQALQQVLHALPPDDRSMLRRHYLDGLTLEEVAKEHGVSRATAARRLADAKRLVVQETLRLLHASIDPAQVSHGALLGFIDSQFEVSLARHLI